MASNLKVQRIIPAYLGLDTDSAPEALAPERGSQHHNFLLDRPGACVMRGPLLKVANNSGLTLENVANPRPLLGHYAHDDGVFFIAGDANASARVAPWESYWKYAASDVELVQQGTARHVLLRTPFTETPIVALPDADSGGWGRGTKWVAGRVYAPSIESTAATVTETGHRRFNTGIALWDPILLPGGGAAWAVANRPQYVIGCRAHYSRLFACGARDGTGFSAFAGYSTDYNPHQIYWTNPINETVAHVATDWRNPVSNQINKATVGAQTTGDACMAVAEQDRNLVIFKRNSVHVLYGYGESTWNIRQVADNLGCIDPRSVVEFGSDVYFMSRQGFMHYDGARFRNVSGLLRSSLVAAAVKRCGPSGTDGGFVHASPHPDGYILVAVGTMSYQTGTSTVDFCGYYYPATDSWSRFFSVAVSTYDDWETGSTFEGGILGFLSANNFTLGFSPLRFYNAAHLFYPEGAPAGEYGLDESATNAANTNGQQASFTSRLYNLSSPLYTSRLQAAMLDYATEVTVGAEDSRLETYIQLVNGAGTDLLAPTSIGSLAAGSTKPRRRYFRDVFNETGNAADVQAVLSLAVGGTVNRAKIFACDVRYQATQERRSA